MCRLLWGKHPTTQQPRLVLELPFSVFSNCFLFHFSQDLGLSYSSLCAQFSSENSLKNSHQTVLCKLRFFSLPLFSNVYLPYSCTALLSVQGYDDRKMLILLRVKVVSNPGDERGLV